MRRLLLVAGALLLSTAALVPFDATATQSASVAQPLAYAIRQPLAGVVGWRSSTRTIYEPGVLLIVGGTLMGLGSWLRRLSAPPPPDA